MAASWTMSNDSIRVIWSTGFTGVTLRLVVHGDSLVGVAATFHDNVTPREPTAPVVAVRSACPQG
jgi:hypothetical protein